MTLLPTRSCNLKRLHRAHAWWSRQHKRYFRCAGKSIISR